jgi:hypothetical protein
MTASIWSRKTSHPCFTHNIFFYVRLLGIIGNNWELLGISRTYAKSAICHLPSAIARRTAARRHEGTTADTGKRQQPASARTHPRARLEQARGTVVRPVLQVRLVRPTNAKTPQPVGATQIRRSIARPASTMPKTNRREHIIITESFVVKRFLSIILPGSDLVAVLALRRLWRPAKRRAARSTNAPAATINRPFCPLAA